jgi:formylglycine-generating enzyme required for sulfatase activity
MSIYILDKNNQPAGPYSDNDVRNWLANKQISPDALARLDGGTEWVPVGSLLGAAHSAPPAVPTPTPTPTPTLFNLPKRFCLRYIALFKSGGKLRKTALILLPLFLLGAIFGENPEEKKSRSKSDGSPSASVKSPTKSVKSPKVSLPKPGAPLTVNLPGDVKLELVSIPAGSFSMGSPESEAGRSDNENQNKVTISKPFWFGKYEVTQGQWKALMGKNPSWFKKNGDNGPVDKVGRDDAKEFCEKLTERERAAGRLPTGYVYTLPTEAQWEYACRAGTATPFNTGSAITTKQANYDDRKNRKQIWKDTLGATMPVGSFPPNAWGLYDMHGNVSEWCLDQGDMSRYAGASYTEDDRGLVYLPIIDPLDTGRSDGRIFDIHRGGSWNHSAVDCRSAARKRLYDFLHDDGRGTGFRVALAPVPKATR